MLHGMQRVGLRYCSEYGGRDGSVGRRLTGPRSFEGSFQVANPAAAFGTAVVRTDHGLACGSSAPPEQASYSLVRAMIQQKTTGLSGVEVGLDRKSGPEVGSGRVGGSGVASR